MNGEERNFDLQSRATNLDTLIGQLGLKTDRVAVELNRDIVPRRKWNAKLNFEMRRYDFGQPDISVLSSMKGSRTAEAQCDDSSR